MLTGEQLREMKQFAINKRRNLSVGMGISKEEILIALTSLDTLIAAYEERVAAVGKLQAIIVANPMRSKSVQKRLRAQGVDATSEGKGANEHRVVRPEGKA